MVKFLDKAKIRVISGHGGNGMVAWRREKYVDKGGPAGGDGGKGGDIYFVADENMSTLLDFKIKSVYKASSGENGGIKGMHGACAKDLYIKVPLGTMVRDTKTGNIIADITEPEQCVSDGLSRLPFLRYPDSFTSAVRPFSAQSSEIGRAHV